MFSDCQILVTTHDERFFNYLKDQLEAKDWHFTRIIGLDPAYGPRFADHKVSDEMIEARWAEGQSAANEMRQAEEEWLLGICRDFGVSVRIRPLERAYSFERSELAWALAGLLRDAKLDPQPVVGVNNRFLTSLQKGEIENFGSHFQDGLYGDGSIGDERARWEEFKAFRAQFACSKCKRTKFQRPITLKKPICAHAGCEAQFEFVRVFGSRTLTQHVALSMATETDSSMGWGWCNPYRLVASRTGPTVTQGFFSHMRRFMAHSAVTTNGLKAISPSRPLPDNRTITSSVCCRYSIGSASSLLSRSS
jgi:hypothetical protein